MITLFFSLTLTSLLHATKPAQASAVATDVGTLLQHLSTNPDTTPCVDLVLEADPRIAVTPQSQAIAQVLDEVTAICQGPAACTPAQLRKEIRLAIGRIDAPPSEVSYLGTLGNRALVIAVWLGAAVGPSALAKVVTWSLDAPEAVQDLLMIVGAALGLDFFGQFSGHLKERLAWSFKQHGAKRWGFVGRWGAMVEEVEETEIAAAQWVQATMLTVRPFVKAGAGSLKTGKIEEAAHFYLNAVLNATDVKAWYNLADNVVLREVRHYVKVQEVTDKASVEALIRATVKDAGMLDEEELPKGVSRAEIQNLVARVLYLWFYEVLKNGAAPSEGELVTQ